MNASEEEVTYLLGLCEEGNGFTLPEIISRVMNENPARIRECARAWNELNLRGMVKVKRRGRPSIYELAPRQM